MAQQISHPLEITDTIVFQAVQTSRHCTNTFFMKTLIDCQQLDAQDPIRHLREQFSLPPGVIYLDGNSLGVLPKTAAARVAEVVTQEWGVDLIRSWNKAGWFEQPQRLGDKIARLVGAGPGELVATDSTSVNLYKVQIGRADRKSVV